MRPRNELRLLPWSGPGGQPCYLSSDNPNGAVSRLADNTEAIQLGLASELLEQATELLAEGQHEPDELRLVALDLADALKETPRVATSRGQRLSQPGHSGPDYGDERLALPAPAF